MKIHTDFSQRVVLNTGQMDWVASPMAGVERKMLDRFAAETGRATSIVRYAPGSYFSGHCHEGGEEFLVLEGTFSDEHSDYPQGSYVRNPIGSKHQPFSKEGCTIFVKLWQFDSGDKEQFSLHPEQSPWELLSAEVQVQRLHQYRGERIQRLRLAAGAEYRVASLGGSELLVLSGAIDESAEQFIKQSTEQSTQRHNSGTWIRNPAGYKTIIRAISDADIYLKQGHLSDFKA